MTIILNIYKKWQIASFFAMIRITMSRLLIICLISIFILGISVPVFFLSQGYRINLPEKSLEKTGMLLVKSKPDGAKVFLDEKFITATNSPVSGLKPGFYNLRISKEGYAEWQKKIEIKEELVTPINTILVSSAPELRPLTKNGVNTFSFSNDKSRIGFLIKKGEKSGLYTLNVNDEGGLPFFRSSSQLVLPDTPNLKVSLAEKITWSPTDEQLLLQMNKQAFYLLNLQRLSEIQFLKSQVETLDQWKKIKNERTLDFISGKEFEKSFEQIATSSANLWTQDYNKVLLKKCQGDFCEHWVKNLKKSLEVNEKRNTFILNAPDNDETKLVWHPDTEHFFLIEKGFLFLVDLDGSNKMPIFQGKIVDGQILPTPDGSKVIILTSFSEKSEPNFYAISLY